MKFKSIALLSSALFSSAVVALSPVVMAQATPLAGAGSRPILQSLQQLRLTPAQKTQLQAIRAQTRSAIDQVLTPTQETKLKQALSQGKPLQEAIALSKITEAQKAQIRQVLLNAQVQVSGVLTNQQRARFFNVLFSARTGQ
jgi:Spy/CpxP family protein refolding chaperone